MVLFCIAMISLILTEIFPKLGKHPLFYFFFSLNSAIITLLLVVTLLSVTQVFIAVLIVSGINIWAVNTVMYFYTFLKKMREQ